MKLETKVAGFIAAEQLLTAGEKVLLAVSGGADSTALLYFMAALKAGGILPVEIFCAHVNHQLRSDEAQRDQDFVVSQCRKLNVPVITRRIDVRKYAKAEKLSIESAARELRIGALLEIAASQNCTCIATAHQKNDNAETILQRLSRGTGFRGLCGIWPAKQFTGGVRFVRPLLCASRDEIIQYLNSRNLKWCTDRTNEDCTYRRNYIRRCLLPAMQKDCAGNLVERFSQLATTSRGFYRQICKSADNVWPNVAAEEQKIVKLNLNVFVAQQPEVKIEIIRRVLFHFDSAEQDITERHYRGVLQLLENEILQLPGDIEVRRRGGAIVFVPRQECGCRAGLAPPKQLKVPGKTEFADVLIEAMTMDYDPTRFGKFRSNKSNTVEWFDLNSIRSPIMVRFRRRGDRFRPLGMKAEKKVGKFLTDEKVPQQSRQKLLVIEDTEKIIWLCPVRISEQTKVTGRTKKILQLRITDI